MPRPDMEISFSAAVMCLAPSKNGGDPLQRNRTAAIAAVRFHIVISGNGHELFPMAAQFNHAGMISYALPSRVTSIGGMTASVSSI